MADVTHNMKVQKLDSEDGGIILNLSIRSLFNSGDKAHETFGEAAAELRRNVVRSPLPTPVQIADFVQSEIKVLQAESEKSGTKNAKR